MIVLWFLGMLFATAFAGSPCPARENLYPCSCINIQGKTRAITTVVHCHHLRDSDVLSIIFRNLKTIKMDHFHLVDSFWEVNSSDIRRKSLPEDWLVQLQSKVIEIVNTPLSSCFACHLKFPCKNFGTTRFSVVNSTVSPKLCTLCDTGRSNSYSWINCMSKLTQLDFTHGNIESLDADFFPRKITGLRVLNLSHNKINNVNTKAFENLAMLTSLDVSHNRISFLDGLFPANMKLEFLDVSWNSIEKLDSMFFSRLQSLKIFKAKNNNIINLTENQWKSAPKTLRWIDLTGNPLHCDCDIAWINTTFSHRVKVEGSCSTPREYENHAIRSKATFFLKKCNKIKKSQMLEDDITAKTYVYFSDHTFQRPSKSNEQTRKSFLNQIRTGHLYEQVTFNP